MYVHVQCAWLKFTYNSVLSSRDEFGVRNKWPTRPGHVFLKNRSLVGSGGMPSQQFFIGTSLSRPYISMTALHMHVCMLVGLDQPLTTYFKRVHPYVSQRPSVVWRATASYSVSVKVKTTQIEVRVATYCKLYQWRQIVKAGGSVADCRKYAWWLTEISSGKGSRMNDAHTQERSSL